MAGIQVQIATDTLTLQIHKAKFSKNVESSAKCLLCLDESEDITHFILRCTALDDVRTPFFLLKLRSLVRDSRNGMRDINELWKTENIIQLIVECTSFHFFNNMKT